MDPLRGRMAGSITGRTVATMPDDPDQSRHPDAAGAAMNEVLAAEQAAARAIGACEQEARELVREAAQAARRIAARTDARITRIHARTRQSLQQHLAETTRADRLAEQARARGDQRLASIDIVAGDLAARLAGDDDDGEASST